MKAQLAAEGQVGMEPVPSVAAWTGRCGICSESGPSRAQWLQPPSGHLVGAQGPQALPCQSDRLVLREQQQKRNEHRSSAQTRARTQAPGLCTHAGMRAGTWHTDAARGQCTDGCRAEVCRFRAWRRTALRPPGLELLKDPARPPYRGLGCPGLTWFDFTLKFEAAAKGWLPSCKV